MLLEHATQEGVQIRYNSQVRHVDSETVSVMLESGERILSDIVVGADGFNSVVRTSVIGKKIPEKREKEVSLNFTIPSHLMMEDDDLRPFAESSDVGCP